MADFGLAALVANQKLKLLQEKWGDDPKTLRTVGAASILAGELTGALEQVAEQNINDEAQRIRQEEILRRSEKSVANIIQQGQKLSALQKTAFIKSGVKIEGSALNVMAETAQRALEAAKVKQRETDFEVGQIEIARAVAEAKADTAVFGALLNSATSTYLLFGGGGGKKNAKNT